jgi:hypothetical protein
MAQGALLFKIDTQRDLTEADRQALMDAVGEGFTCGSLEGDHLPHVWVSPTEPLPPGEAGRFDGARERFLAVLRERGLVW